MGEERERGMEIEVEEVNEDGGIKGEKVVIERGDEVEKKKDKGEDRRMIQIVGVKEILGNYYQERVIEEQKVREIEGIKYLEMGEVEEEVKGSGLKYILRKNKKEEKMEKEYVDMIIKGIDKGIGKEKKDMKIGIIYEEY